MNTNTAFFTTAEFVRMPDAKHFELVHGEIVAKKSDVPSALTAGEVFFRLSSYTDEHGGWAFPGGLHYQCRQNIPNQLRNPDVSFIASGKLLEEYWTADFLPFPPDIAIEAVSLDDREAGLESKVAEYLEGGVRSVWVISPGVRRVWVYSADGRVYQLSDKDDLTDETVLPGFRVPIAKLFPAAKTDTI